MDQGEEEDMLSNGEAEPKVNANESSHLVLAERILGDNVVALVTPDLHRENMRASR